MKFLAFLPFLVAVFVLFVFLPRRRIKAVEALQSQLQEGDEIMTRGGLFGRITRLDQDSLHLEIAPGTVVRMARGAVALRIADLTPDPPAPDAASPDELAD